MRNSKKLLKGLLTFCLFIMFIAGRIEKVSAASVINMRLYSTTQTVSNMHSWLVFKNNTSSSVKIGNLSVSAGDSVTVGTWPDSKHYGVWYNSEGYLGISATHVSTSINLSVSQLNSVNTKIKNSDKWSAGVNCSTFASAVWNTVASQKLSAGNPGTPTALANQIKFYTSYQTNYAIPKKTSKQTYYNKTNGVVQAVPSGKFSFSSASVISELLEMDPSLALYFNEPSFKIVE